MGSGAHGVSVTPHGGRVGFSCVCPISYKCGACEKAVLGNFDWVTSSKKESICRDSDAKNPIGRYARDKGG